VLPAHLKKEQEDILSVDPLSQGNQSVSDISTSQIKSPDEKQAEREFQEI
jgi:hypothetical protein